MCLLVFLIIDKSAYYGMFYSEQVSKVWQSNTFVECMVHFIFCGKNCMINPCSRTK